MNKFFLTLLLVGVAHASGPTMSGYDNYMSPWHYAFTLDNNVERYELRNGDCAVSSAGYSDCEHNNGRSELTLIEKARYNQDITYSWSFYNESIPTIGLYTVIGQWKTHEGKDPILYIRQRPSWHAYDVVLDLESLGKAPCRLFSMEESKGKWIDITINTNFSTSSDGYVNIWIDGIQRCEYKGTMMAKTLSLTEGPSHRRGIYIQKRGGVKDHPTLIARYKNFEVK